MRRILGAAAGLAALGAAGAALAEPTLRIDHAVVRVTVVPEARGDIKVDVVGANPRLPLRVWSFLGTTYVDGGVGGARIRGCRGALANPTVNVLGLGDVAGAALPAIVVHTPLNVRVSASGAVFGQVRPSNSLQIDSAGCGDWQLARTRGALKAVVAGSASMRADQAGAADLMTAGSGSITASAVGGPMHVMNVGSGDVEVASLNGPLAARIAGSGHLRVDGGHVTAMQVSIAGSGDVIVLGVADSLKAFLAGSGGVRVARVTGAVSQTVMGSGRVRVGS